jgi:hypothetical protein
MCELAARMKNAARVSLVFAMGLICLGSGCGVGSSDDMLDAQALLDRYQQDRRRHDPIHFSEVDLGEFYITKRYSPSIYYVRFHIYGVVPENQLDQFSEILQPHTQRVRDAVIAAVQRSELEHLDDPSLGWLKSELILTINRNLQMRMLRDVVFTDYSLERG